MASSKIDGVIDVTFRVPHQNMSAESAKELSIDLEVRGPGARGAGLGGWGLEAEGEDM
jgi:hypothetical protein